MVSWETATWRGRLEAVQRWDFRRRMVRTDLETLRLEESQWGNPSAGRYQELGIN